MKSELRNIILFFSYFVGIPLFLRRAQRNNLTILLYHGVAPTVDNGIFNYRKKFISQEQFDKQIDYLKKKYSVMELDAAVDKLRNGEALPPFPLCITFDDGYRNNLEYALPILQKHSVPATVFVVTNFIDKKEPLWVDRLEYAVGNGSTYAGKSYKEKTSADDTLRSALKKISNEERENRLRAIENENNASLDISKVEFYAPCTWEEMRKCSDSVVRFGAHTQNHPILTKLPLQEAKAEIGNSFHVLQEKIPNPSQVFAYPNGQPSDFNEEIKNATADLGYTAALTTIPGTNARESDMYELRRYTMDGTESMISFKTKLTGTLEWLKELF